MRVARCAEGFTKELHVFQILNVVFQMLNANLQFKDKINHTRLGKVVGNTVHRLLLLDKFRDRHLLLATNAVGKR